MRPSHTPVLSSSPSASSSRWLARSKRDPFSNSSNTDVNAAKYVARSAHKLLELDRRHRGLLRPGRVVLECGGAPGGWTQVCLDRLRGRGKIVSVDLLDHDSRVSSAVAGVGSKVNLHIIKGDLRAQGTIDSIEHALAGEKVDVVLSDMLANTSGNHTRDSSASLELCQLVESLSHRFRAEGTVMKVLQSQEADEWRRDVLGKAYDTVRWEKPEASRKESREGYLVCRGRRAMVG